MDERVYPRWSIAVPVSFTGEQLSGVGTVTNLSLGGCAVRSRDRAHKGRLLSLCLHLQHPADAVIIASAEVRWTVPDGFGVQFRSVPREELERLRRFLQTLERGADRPS